MGALQRQVHDTINLTQFIAPANDELFAEASRMNLGSLQLPTQRTRTAGPFAGG